MKRFKKGVILLIVLICVSLAACGENAAVSDGEIAGGDWRTTGIVRDSGSIARGGEVTEVLICVHKEDAAFYYDKAEQVLFADVKYPMAVNDPWESYKSTDFADINGDGNSDVSMTFVLSDGDTVAMTWLWDSEQEAYIFNEELSSVMGGPEK